MAHLAGRVGEDSPLGSLKTLRVLRALRPLRLIQRLPTMRLVVSTLFMSTAAREPSYPQIRPSS